MILVTISCCVKMNHKKGECIRGLVIDEGDNDMWTTKDSFHWKNNLLNIVQVFSF